MARNVRVAVEAVADRPERTFTYRLPDDLDGSRPGSLVLVPYGRRRSLGYLLDGPPEALPGDVREVEAVVSEPMLTSDLLRVAEEIASYYRAPLGTTIAAMLPPGLESHLVRRWAVLDPEALPPAARALVVDGELDDAGLLRHAPADGRERWLETLRRSGVVRARWSLRPPQLRERRVRVVRRVPGGPAPRRGAPRQAALLAALETDVERPLLELGTELGVEPAALLPAARRLAELGAVELGWRAALRDPLAHRTSADGLHELVAEQLAAVDAIAAVGAGGELVLEGVAASGKSDVYLAAAEAQLRLGRGTIMLVPELSLVPQLADRAAARFGDVLAVLHSGLAAGERHDEWWRIVRGDARIVLGTRSAVFAPVARLGLIIVDEEHDGGYKSDRTPRYDARWVARQRAAASGACVVAGSATPAIVTLARVRGGHAERVRLTARRVGTAPRIEVVDMRAELAAGNRSIFSDPLAAALRDLPRGEEQAILLINRRGAATFVLCRDCGESVRCRDCDLPMVFHLAGERLRCHHCGSGALPPERCPGCGSSRIRYFGAGTQRVEAELQRLVPSLRVARLDSDAVAARRGFETVYDDFREGRTDVLVGTQLAAKGLDLPSVTLAAVVAADVTLNLPDYRAPERTFALLAQVAGRAGRGPRAGRVIIQTYAPHHDAVRLAARLDIDGFADSELARRRELGYPPYSVLARLMIADADRRRAEARGAEAAQAVGIHGVEVLGPLPAYVPRRAGRWRMQVVMRAPDVATRARSLALVPAGVGIDVDPESLL